MALLSLLVGKSFVFFLCTPSFLCDNLRFCGNLKYKLLVGLGTGKNGNYELSFLGTWLDTGDDDDN